MPRTSWTPRPPRADQPPAEHRPQEHQHDQHVEEEPRPDHQRHRIALGQVLGAGVHHAEQRHGADHQHDAAQRMAMARRRDELGDLQCGVFKADAAGAFTPCRAAVLASCRDGLSRERRRSRDSGRRDRRPRRRWCAGGSDGSAAMRRRYSSATRSAIRQAPAAEMPQKMPSFAAICRAISSASCWLTYSSRSTLAWR